MNKAISFFPLSILAVVMATGIPGTARAAAYLKLGDIKGEVRDAAHKEQIEVLSYQMGEAKAAATGAASQAGSVDSRKRQHGWITITKRVDKATPKLYEASVNGKVYPTAIVSVPNTTGGGAAYLEYKLENVMVSNYSTSGSGADSTETITLNYEKMTTGYKPQDKKVRESPTGTGRVKEPQPSDP